MGRIQAGGARLAALLAAGLLALAAACGGDGETARPSGAPMAASQPPEERASNAAPLLERVAVSPRDPLPGAPVEAVVEARDPDGDPVTLTYTLRVNGDVVARGRQARIEPRGVRREDRLEVEVVASDGVLESETRRDRVRFANRPPRVRAVDLDAGEGLRPGDVVTALVDAVDPDGDSLRLEYEWRVNDEPVDGEEKTFSTEGLERGDRVAVRVVARDGREESRAETSRPVEIGNSPPRLAEVPAPTRENGVFKWDFEASDPDGDRSLRFSLNEAPEGMTIDPILGVVHWRPSPEQAGSHVVEVVVEDPSGAASGMRFDAKVSTEVAGRDEGGEETPPPAAPAP